MADGDTDGWPNGRRAVTYREVRSVLDAQQATMADIDDKALRTVRIALLIGGLVLTTVRLTQGTVSLGLALPGVVVLLFSVTTGVVTYSESDIHLGPNRAYIHQLERNDFTGRTWDSDLLLTLGDWVEVNAKEVELNGRLLLASQLSLLAGGTLLGLSIVL